MWARFVRPAPSGRSETFLGPCSQSPPTQFVSAPGPRVTDTFPPYSIALNCSSRSPLNCFNIPNSKTLRSASLPLKQRYVCLGGPNGAHIRGVIGPKTDALGPNAGKKHGQMCWPLRRRRGNANGSSAGSDVGNSIGTALIW